MSSELYNILQYSTTLCRLRVALVLHWCILIGSLSTLPCVWTNIAHSLESKGCCDAVKHSTVMGYARK